MRRLIAPSSALLGIVALAACAGTPSATGTQAASTSSAPTSDAADPTAAQTLAPTAVGWFAGNRVTLTAAAYDPDAQEIVISLDAENTANTDSFEDVDGISLDTGSGAPLEFPRASSIAVASSTTGIDLTFTAPADGVDLAASVLQLGGPGEKQWLLPLDPAEDATGVEPQEFPITGSADAGGLVFQISSVQVLPWACDDSDGYGPGDSGRIYYEVGAEDESAVVLWGDIVENESIYGGDALDSATLQAPDGTTSPYIGLVTKVFDQGQTVEDFGLCFSVKDPTAGAYTLTWNSYRKATATFGFTLD